MTMIRILFILTLTVACKDVKVDRVSRESIVSKENDVKIVYQKQGEYKMFVDSVYQKEKVNCRNRRMVITENDGIREFWNICSSYSSSRKIEINYYENESLFTEIYFTSDGKLIYAEEWEQYLPINSFVQKTWNCQFYIDNNQVVDLISLGHGKTEDEDWEPENILKMFDERLRVISNISEN